MGNNIQSVCRICTSRKVDGKSIFASEKFSDKVMEIQEVIVVCASVQIQRNDRLPKEICSRCLMFLHQAYNFKNLCEDSDFKLRNHVGQNGIETDVMKDVDEEMHDFNYNYSGRDLEDTDSELEELNFNQSIDNSDDSLDVVFVEETQASNYSNAIEVEDEQTADLDVLSDLLNSEKSFDNSDASSDVIFVEEPQLLNINNSDGVNVKQEKIFVFEETELHSLSYSVQSNNEKPLDISEPKIEFVGNIENTESNESTNLEEDSALKKDNSKKSLNQNTGEYKCVICNKQVASLKEHMRVHVGEKCLEWKKVHSRENDSQCNICNKQIRSHNLRRHMQTHTGDKAHGSLVVHRSLKHTDVRSFECDMCSKVLSTREGIIKHIRNHKIKCDICEKEFTQLDQLKGHKQQHITTNFRNTINKKLSQILRT